MDTEERVLQERDKGSQDKGLEDRDTLDKDLVDRALSGKGKDLVDKSVPDTVVDLALARVVQDSSATKAADLGAEASQELDMEEEHSDPKLATTDRREVGLAAAPGIWEDLDPNLELLEVKDLATLEAMVLEAVTVLEAATALEVATVLEVAMALEVATALREEEKGVEFGLKPIL